MPEYIFYTIGLQAGVDGLIRGLTEGHVTVRRSAITDKTAMIEIDLDGQSGLITLEESVARAHPLARLGCIRALRITTPEGWTALEPIVRRALLRTGG
ncbi:MAG: hypothetical protein HY710_01780 [Candidatus Latescibacteria bacterium]|nr:hypothetical protein [Candidatus Latescibacterota bacterium]